MLQCSNIFGRFLVLMVLGLLALSPGVAAAECVVIGESVAEPNPDDPSLGFWKYSVMVEWDSGTPHALSHLDVLLDLAACGCVCDEFPFAAQDAAGTSTGTDGQEEPCTVSYSAEYLCDGDLSIGVTDPLVKFEPLEGECGPGPTGIGVFYFYTDWPPIETTLPNALVAFKASGDACFGVLHGDLPECVCNSTDVQEGSWGVVKSLFLR